MGLQAVLTDPFGIGEIGLHRHDARGSQLGCFFDDEVRARLFDGREQKPKIGRVALGRGLLDRLNRGALFGGLAQPGAPFTLLPVEYRNFIAHALAHHRNKVMRLIRGQRHGLPCGQGVIYMKPDPCHRGQAKLMPQPTPEPQSVIDAPQGNWVDRYAPQATRPWLRLSRADRPIGTWLLLLPCWWGLALAALASGGFGWRDLWIALACVLGAFVMRGAGCTWNDITDRKIDAQVARTRSRPIPSGQVSVRGALIWLVLQVAIGAAILLTLGPAAIWLGLISLGPVVIYPFAKRFTWWPQLFLGIAFNWGALLAWAASRGQLEWPAVLLYASGMVWTLFYDTIYAHQDKEDDALIGVKSTARLFGQDTARWLGLFLLGAVGLMTLAVLAALSQGAGPVPWLLALAAPAGFAAHLFWQLRSLQVDDTETCLRLFRSNRDSGLIVALFLAVAAIVN